MNKTINDLEQITTVSTSDELPIFSENETKKVTVGQLRDIKDVYSTEETLTNKVWIDGKPIYRKVVDCGALPNNSLKTVAHNIANIGFVINLYGIASDGSEWLPLPASYYSNSAVGLSVDGTNISLRPYTNRTTYTTTYVTIEYTKSTD